MVDQRWRKENGRERLIFLITQPELWTESWELSFFLPLATHKTIFKSFQIEEDVFFFIFLKTSRGDNIPQ
jgi:hypothetical protein